MQTGLRRCLYVGLGGTGMHSLLHTKKMFIETYGEVPPMIAFLGFDTDGGVYNKTIDSKYGKVGLNASEQCSLVTPDAIPIYERNKAVHFTWMPTENESAIESMTTGAGQIRTNGRLAISIHYDKVKSSINSAITQITNANIVSNPNYKTLANGIEVHMVFSICGGTGSGTFIDAAYLIRSILPNDGKLIGYAVLPEVFETMVPPPSPAMARVKSNAYGALQDLDFLMHLSSSSKPVELKYFSETINVKQRPFNAIMLIDNKNQNNDTFTHVNQLSEMISLSLVISAGELSISTASVSDNIDKYIADGSMGVKNKRAWIAGVGACEILFKGDELADIYSLKAGQRLIQRLLSGCHDIDALVNQWIDEVKIRENNGRDDIIDCLLEQKPKFLIHDISDAVKPQVEINQYLSAIKGDEKNIQPNLDKKYEETEKALNKYLIYHLNQECGIDNCENIILGIQQQIEIFIGEMTEEIELFSNKAPQLDANIKSLSSDLNEIASKTFIINKSAKLREIKEDLTSTIYQLAINRRELVRRRAAVVFYNKMNGLLLEKENQFDIIKRQIKGIYTDLSSRLSNIQNQVGNNTQMFQIDLAPQLAQTIKVDEEELSVDEFVKHLSQDNGIYNFDRLKKAEVEELILDYTRQLSRAEKERSRTIDDVINSLDENEFNNLMDMANSKSLTLLQKNYKGYVPETSLYQGFYIGVPNNNKSRLIDSDALKNRIGAINLDFVPTGMNDRIIFYRQEGVIPVFALEVLYGLKARYDKARGCSPFDNNLLIRMQREEFDFFPQEEDDKSINIWVLGLVFGLIKNENGSYHYKNKKEGQPLTDYWIDLKTSYRDEAFDQFKSNISTVLKDYEETISNIETNKGSIEIEEFKNKVKSSYYEKFSQVGIPLEKLLERENKRIAALLNDEIRFVNEQL